MNFKSTDYLQNPEERIEHLRKIIDGRTVAILAAGPSIKELEKRIDELRHADICYFGFNCFVQEQCILQKIDEYYSLYADPCGNNLPKTINDVISFLERPDDNMLISTFGRHDDTFDLLGEDFDLGQFLDAYDKKLVFFSLSYDRTVPNEDQPLHFISGNTLQMVIQMAIIGKASKIVLFGADGGKPIEEISDVSALWYKHSSSYGANEGNIYTLFLDTNLCFNPIMPLAIRNVYKTYNLPLIEILNCTKYSYYSPFPVISYDDAFEFLLTNKKVNSKSDLRTPKLSLITIALDNNRLLKETLDNLMEQTYPKFEHIIVHNNNEDHEIGDMKRRYPQVQWVYGNDCSWQEGIRKGISLARGKNICYHCPGNLFANPDWLNICMDILENHPEIALVWGLSQEMSDNNGAPGRIIKMEFLDDPPPQGKEFIDYWLKKKSCFPEESFCVRKSTLEACLPLEDNKMANECAYWLSFNYNFNTSGYLPFFVPLVANYHRTYFDQGGHRPQGDPVKMHLPYYVPITETEEVRKKAPDKNLDTRMNEYHRKIRQYRNSVLTGKVFHRFRDGFGEELEDNFSRFEYFFGDILGSLKRKVPHRYSLLINRTFNALKNYRLGIFKAVIVKISDRLIKLSAQIRCKQKDSIL